MDFPTRANHCDEVWLNNGYDRYVRHYISTIFHGMVKGPASQHAYNDSNRIFRFKADSL